MNVFDVIVLLVLIGFVVNGIRKGLFTEVLGLIGTFGGLVAGLLLAGPLSNLVLKFIPEYYGILVHLVCFTILFAAVYAGTRVLSKRLDQLSEKLSINWLNNILGGLFAGFKGAVIVSLVLMYLSFLPLQFLLTPYQKDSILYQPLYNLVPKLYELIGSPDQLPKQVREILDKNRDRFMDENGGDDQPEYR